MKSLTIACLCRFGSLQHLPRLFADCRTPTQAAAKIEWADLVPKSEPIP